MPKTIAVLSQKGGTGKTTAVRTLSDAFRRRGVSTLAIDLDPQGNLSDYFDLPPDVQPTVAEVLLGTASVQQATHSDMVPANLSLAEAELLLGGKMGRELTLRRAIAGEPPPYDLILVDCPPSLGLLTVNALVAADHALITAEAQYFALQGVEQAIEVVELARDSLNPGLTLLGVLLNVADMRTVHSREALASLRERFDSQVFDTVIRASIAYAESAERAVSILDHRPDLGADYLALAEEVIARLPPLNAHDDATAHESASADGPAASTAPPAPQPAAAEENPPAPAAAPEPPTTRDDAPAAQPESETAMAREEAAAGEPAAAEHESPAAAPPLPAPSPVPGSARAEPSETEHAAEGPARERIVDGAQAPDGEQGYERSERSHELGAGASPQ